MKSRKIAKSEFKKLILEEGEKYPQSLIDWYTRGEVFKYDCIIYSDRIYYKGETPETAVEWAVVANNGGTYKYRAEFAFWHECSDGDIVLQCVWTFSHLEKTVRSFLRGNGKLPDPGYQT